MLQNVRYALRQLGRSPGYAAVAVGTLALGIGANTAIFSLVEAALLRGLPFREPSRLVALWERNPSSQNPRNQVSSPNFVRWQERARSFESSAAYAPVPTTIAGADDAVRVAMGLVSTSFFDTLGATPALGRGFVTADGAPGAPPTAVLSDRLWRTRYAADAGIVGRSILVEGQPTAVAGVMPPDFDLPSGSALWLPITVDEPFREQGGRWLGVIARLKPGVSVAQATAEMDLLAANLARERPAKNTGWGATVRPLHDDLVGGVRPQLLLLMAGVGILLVMACVNVASLTLSRALTRMREFAIRTALGAGRGRILRQMLTESLVLCILGAATGLLVGHWALRALTASVPTDIPNFMEPRLGGAVVSFAVLACLAAAMLTGIIPALRLAGSPLLPALREGAAGGGVGPARRRLRGLLVAGQMGLALVLVAGGGLLLRSYSRLMDVNIGFDPHPVLSLDVSLPSGSYADPAAQSRFFQEAVDALAQTPGVESAGGISYLPLTLGSRTDFEVVGRPVVIGNEPGADVRFIAPGTFRTLGIRLLEGRDFTAEDTLDRPTVVVVNETVARQMWPGESALGKRVRMEWDSMLDAEVIGVVGDVRMKSIGVPAYNTLYWSHRQVPTSFMTLVVKARAVTPESLTPAAVAAIRAIDKGVAVEARPLEDFVAGTLQQQSFTLTLTMAFAFTAIALAAVGLFGVVGQAVGERRREFALRIALGAPRDSIRGLVLGEGFRWTVAGAVVGLPAAIVVGHALQQFLFETSPADPVTYGSVVAILATAALLAVALPAWRAARVDPRVVLRDGLGAGPPAARAGGR